MLDGALLPNGSKTGAILKAEAETELDGITILSVSSGKEKAGKSNTLEILPSDKPFEAVTQQLATRGRSDRPDRSDRGDRRDRPPRRTDRDAPGRGPRRDGAPRPEGEQRTDRAERAPRAERPERRQRPSFTVPPELPQRPKAKRLRPGRAHRNAVLAELPEAQRPVAERALQGGMQAVRQAVVEQNARLKAEGKEEIPAAGLLSMAEQLLPKLRVAEWLDRADAALADLDELDLRDLRSVVASGEDPAVVRDEAARELSVKLKEALAAKQEKELTLWFGDIEAAIGVGRIVRALKLSSQPPKAGVRFPAELAARLAAATTASLTADALPDRWVAVLEAAAFAPIRSQVVPTQKPTQVSDELLATVKRIAPLLPQVAALFDVAVAPGAHAPKPLRPTRPASAKKPGARAIPAPPKPPEAAAAPAAEAAPAEPDAQADQAPATSVERDAVVPEPDAVVPEPDAVVPEPAETATVPEPAETATVPEPAETATVPEPAEAATEAEPTEAV